MNTEEFHFKVFNDYFAAGTSYASLSTSTYYTMYKFMWLPNVSEKAFKVYAMDMSDCSITNSATPSDSTFVAMWGATSLTHSTTEIWIGGNTGVSSPTGLDEFYPYIEKWDYSLSTREYNFFMDTLYSNVSYSIDALQYRFNSGKPYVYGLAFPRDGSFGFHETTHVMVIKIYTSATASANSDGCTGIAD